MREPAHPHGASAQVQAKPLDAGGHPLRRPAGTRNPLLSTVAHAVAVTVTATASDVWGYGRSGLEAVAVPVSAATRGTSR